MVKIPVTNRRGEVVAHALVDDNWSHLAQLKWHLHKKGYVYRQTRLKGAWWIKPTCYLHRLVTDCPPDKDVDHKDANPLNCQSSNLQIVTKKYNNQLRSARRKLSTVAVTSTPSYGDVPV